MPTINFAGLASGIDSTALIEAISAATRQAKVKPHEDHIAELEDTDTSLEDLKTKLQSLQTLIRDFATINGGGVIKAASSSDETVLTATASNSANNGTYSLSINQLAKNATYGFKSTATYTSSSDAINSAITDLNPGRNVTVEVGQGTNLETVTIDLLNTTTLDGYVTSYNAVATKSIASVVNVGTTSSPDYRVIIVTNNEGLEKGEITVTVGSEVTTAGSGAFNNNSVSQATNATFTMSGIGAGAGDTITRSSNTISDVIPGVSLNLEATGSATLSVSNDASATSAKVQEIVTAYNEVVQFISENNIVYSR